MVYLLLGLANGAVFASLALAMVLTFRSSGVVNFATSGIALATAYLFTYLRQGKLLLLLPGLPQTVDLGFTPGLALSLLIAVLAAALFGLVLYVVVFRPMRTATPVAKAVASLGLLVLITGVVTQKVGLTAIFVDPIFPSGTVTVGTTHIPEDGILFAGLILVITAALAAVYRFTRFGLYTRAVAETETGSVLAGISPDKVAAVNWMVGSGVAGLAGILISPIQAGLVPYSFTLFVVPALAAAIFAQFKNIGIAVLAGLAVGIIESELAYLQSRHKWLPQSGLSELVPLLLILFVLVVRGNPLQRRGTMVLQSLGRAPRPTRLLLPTVVGSAAVLLTASLTHGTWRAALVTSLIFAVIGLSQVVVTGFAGQISLAQLVLAGVAGFSLSSLTISWGVPFPLAPLLAALAASAVGVLVGLPALRVRGLPFAVVTLALSAFIEAFWFSNVDFVGAGGEDIGNPSLFGWDLGPGSGAAYPRMIFVVLVLAVVIAVAWSVAKIRQGAMGTAMLAVRANEKTAAASGINVVGTKITAFALGAFIAGLGGSLLAYQQGNVTNQSFDAILGLSTFAIIYLCGVTSVSGGLLSGLLCANGLVYVAASTWFHLSFDWYQVIAGAGLVYTVIRSPEGLTQTVRGWFTGRSKAASVDEAADETGLAPAALAWAEPDHPASRRSHAVHLDPDQAALALEQVGVSYGGVVALSGVSFDVAPGSIVGVIGPNGAGKTTLIDAISGFAPMSGAVRLGGKQIHGLAPYERTRAGLGRTFQSLELWEDLTVEENVIASQVANRRKGSDTAAADALALLGVHAARSRPAGELSHGNKQLLSIARAVAGSPALLMLDEPAAGLDSTESGVLGKKLLAIRDSGISILLVEHDMSLVLSICDRIVVLNFGEVIARGTPAEIRTDPAVVAAYLGATHAAVAEGAK